MNGAVHLFNVMKEEGVKPDVVTYSTLMDGFSKANNPEKVSQLFDGMVKNGIKPNLYIFNTAIRACAIDIDLKRAALLFSSMQQKYSLKPDDRTYGSLLHVCAVAGKLDLAKKCFARMGQEGIPKNVVTYNSFIDAYANATNKGKGQQHLNECSSLLKSMRTEQIMPDDRTYNALIKVCTRGQLMQDALKFYSEMKNSGLKPSLFTFNMLFDGFAKTSTITKEEAEVRMGLLVDEMSKRQLKPSLETYSTLINLCCKVEDLGRAKEFFRQLKRNGLQPNISCCGAMIKCYHKLGDPLTKEKNLNPLVDLMEQLETLGTQQNNAIKEKMKKIGST